MFFYATIGLNGVENVSKDRRLLFRYIFIFEIHVGVKELKDTGK